MDDIALKLNIQRPSDWGGVTVKQVSELGGSYILRRYYNKSLFACLRSIYKGS